MKNRNCNRMLQTTLCLHMRVILQQKNRRGKNDDNELVWFAM